MGIHKNIDRPNYFTIIEKSPHFLFGVHPLHFLSLNDDHQSNAII